MANEVVLPAMIGDGRPNGSIGDTWADGACSEASALADVVGLLEVQVFAELPFALGGVDFLAARFVAVCAARVPT